MGVTSGELIRTCFYLGECAIHVISVASLGTGQLHSIDSTIFSRACLVSIFSP